MGDYGKKIQALLVGKERMLIGGDWAQARSRRAFPTHDPATEEKLCEAALAGDEDVESAVQAAAGAFAGWRKLDPFERGQKVSALARALREHAEDFALLDAIDSGNPVTAMKGDVLMAAAIMDYFAGLAGELKGQILPGKEGMLHTVFQEPFGVVARIVPFNHPIFFAACKIAAPLVAGNTLILKPAEQTPLSALEMGKYIREIFPPGVINIVTGDGPLTGAALVKHPKIKRIALTGGVDTGRAVMKLSAEGGIKQITLELGGKNPMIVFPDVELDKAVESAVVGMNFHWCQGQSCGSTSRLFLHKKIHDEFLRRLIERAGRIKIGQPLDPETEMGCLASQDQYEKTLRYIDVGKKDGAKLAAGGGRPEGATFAKGYFVKPTIFDGVDMSMRIAREEIFGPVLSVFSWEDYDAVVEQANQVDYGLTASIWSRDLQLAYRTAERIEAGYIWINGSSRHFLGVPFGGFKQSGIGREESVEELLSYVQTKAVNAAL
ncbi:MAG: aldehyde dehydrogenase [Deltaproteobacteria bacterium RIFCSPLOWO2_12_FULL_60_19]|nr:MAG: aldehyde dehydrogenase [Deltaproteobacteria bacterium RIFCSPLOWO2_12_FULL_60_19]